MSNGSFWDDPADLYPGASNHVELTGPDQEGNEHVVSLVGGATDHPMVGDTGLNRKVMGS